MSKNFNICCPDCFSKDLYKYGKDNTGEQKYRCKTCHRQFTKNASAKQKLNYPDMIPIKDTYILSTN